MLAVAACARPPVRHAAGEPPADVEVVTTIPVETTLSAQGTRQAAEAWPGMIGAAAVSVDVAAFYLAHKEGEALGPVIDALRAAGARGVRVRVLAEKGMAESSKAALGLLAGAAGVEVRLFDWKEKTGGILHAKYLVVDGREAFVGSQNLDWRSLRHIHETGLRVRSAKLAAALGCLFERDWEEAGGGAPPFAAAACAGPLSLPAAVGLVASPPERLPAGIDGALDALVGLVDGAKERIAIELLHYARQDAYSPGQFDRIDEALRRAAARGVRVRMLVADWSKKEPDVNDLKSLAQVENVAVRFVSFPQASEGFIPYARVLHSKVMRVDGDVSWVGTSNWSRGYFFTSRNVELTSSLPAVAATLDALFEELWASGYAAPVDPSAAYTPPRTH